MFENKNTIQVLLLVAMTAIFSSCGQLTSLQSAKVLDKNEVTLGGSLMGYGVNEDNVSGGELGAGVFPYSEVFSRWGLGKNLDMGLKISTGGNFLLDGKYQFVGNSESNFAAAIGGGVEFQVSNFDENIVFRTHLPLYLSYHPTEQSAIYLSPRYVFQSVSNDNNSFFLGGSLGYSHRFSPNITGLLEGSYYNPQTFNTINDGTNLFLFGIGCAYHFN